MTAFFNTLLTGTLKIFSGSYYRTSAVFAAIFLMVLACEEDPSPIGAGILPDDDFASLFVTDTFTVNAYTMYDDSVRTNDTSYFFGRRYNPYFGTTEAELVTQLNLLASWPGTGLYAVDSVKLVLTIKDYEGDTIFYDQQVQLAEIDEFLSKDIEYYSNKPVLIKQYIGTYLMDSLRSDTTILIDMPISVGEYLLRDTTKLFISSTEPDFRDFFRGIHMKLISNPNPAFITLSTLSASSGIEIYYRDAAAANKIYSFVLSAKSACYKRIIHDFETANPAIKINHYNDFVKDTVVYQQKVNGVYTRLEIPGLEALRENLPASVSMARLILPVYLDGDIFTDTTVPSNIYLRYADALGVKYPVPDIRLGYNYFGGYYRLEDDNYALNIASFVQEYLEGRIPEPVVEIFMPQGYDADLILKANSASKKIKLELAMARF
ncbi:MAG: DUF4270 family protein [Bacteroidales bacterium]|jgi:hypothetical protein|nr:DUF4270 family protein [Bacteroidales bacterium]